MSQGSASSLCPHRGEGDVGHRGGGGEFGCISAGESALGRFTFEKPDPRNLSAVEWATVYFPSSSNGHFFKDPVWGQNLGRIKGLPKNCPELRSKTPTRPLFWSGYVNSWSGSGPPGVFRVQAWPTTTHMFGNELIFLRAYQRTKAVQVAEELHAETYE